MIRLLSSAGIALALAFQSAIGQTPVPHHIGLLGQRNAYAFPRRVRRVEQTQLNHGRVRRE